MSIEETLDRLASNVALLTGAVATLSESVNGKYAGKPIYADLKSPAAPDAANSAPVTTEAAPQKRGRGRPVKGEDVALAAPAPAPAVVEAADPFFSAPAAPVATLDDVRKALTALRAAVNQDVALAVLKSSGGAANLTDLPVEKYGTVVAAVNAKIAEYLKAPPAPTPAAPVADPFATDVVQPAAPAASAEKPLTLEDVKLVIVETQKRASQDAVQKVVMEHGGKAPNPAGGEGPSLKALPADKFAATVAALKALPTTK